MCSRLLYWLTIITGEMYLILTTHLNLKTMNLVIMIVILIETVGKYQLIFIQNVNLVKTVICVHCRLNPLCAVVMYR